jgi:hypothetical protein
VLQVQQAVMALQSLLQSLRQSALLLLLPSNYLLELLQVPQMLHQLQMVWQLEQQV